MIFAVLFFSAIADFSAFTPAHAEEGSWSRWQEARQLYQSGKYDDAFQSLIAQPNGNDPVYFYNLGTISYRMGRKGAALGYFEKANPLKRH